MLRMGLLMLALCWSMPLYATLSLDLMDKLTESPENLRGQFVQKKTVKAFDVTIKSSGDFHYRRHQFIDWHTHKPVANQLRMTPSQITSQQGDQSLMQIDTDADPTVKVLSQIFFAVLTAEWLGISDTQINHWPGKPRSPHLQVVVINFVEQGTAGNFKIFDVMTMPGNGHDIDIMKGNINIRLGLNHTLCSAWSVPALRQNE